MSDSVDNKVDETPVPPSSASMLEDEKDTKIKELEKRISELEEEKELLAKPEGYKVKKENMYAYLLWLKQYVNKRIPEQPPKGELAVKNRAGEIQNVVTKTTDFILATYAFEKYMTELDLKTLLKN